MANVTAIIRKTNVSLSQPRFTIMIRPAAMINNGSGGVSSYNDLDDVPTEFPPEAHFHAIADVTGLQGALDGKASSVHAHAISDVTGLQGALDGKQAGLGFTPEDAINKGAAGGYASLDGTGKVPAVQLPSYVDDVVEAANFVALPATGETGKIYVTLDTNAQYRWSGSAYTQLTASPGTTDAVPEGTSNLYFTTARVLATALTGFATSGTRTAVVAADTVLQAFGKIQKYLSDLASIAFSGSASDLTAGTLPAARFDDTAHGSRAGGALHPAASTSVAGFMSGADKTKLDGVATGATANSPDATLLARANHTGSQLAATISDFAAAVAGLITGKQDTLVSTANIKTVNGNSLLGSGNLVISGGGAPNIGPDYTAKSTGTLVLTVASPEYQFFTGVTGGQVVELPDPATTPEGQRFYIKNVEGAGITLTTGSGGFGVGPGQAFRMVRGFSIDGVTPEWVRDEVVSEIISDLEINRVLLFSDDNEISPLYILPNPDVVEVSMLDGSVWMTDTTLKIKVGGTVHDLLAGGTSVLSTEIDVGPLPVKEASINVIDATVTPTTKISAYQSGRAATGRPADENQWTRLHVVARPNTGSFDLWVLCLNGTMSGTFNIEYLKG